MEEQYAYWKIWYESCEGNERWIVARTPIDWDEYEVRERIPMGDDVAEIISVTETGDDNYCWDFTD